MIDSELIQFYENLVGHEYTPMRTRGTPCVGNKPSSKCIQSVPSNGKAHKESKSSQIQRSCRAGDYAFKKAMRGVA